MLPFRIVFEFVNKFVPNTSNTNLVPIFECVILLQFLFPLRSLRFVALHFYVILRINFDWNRVINETELSYIYIYLIHVYNRISENSNFKVSEGKKIKKIECPSNTHHDEFSISTHSVNRFPTMCICCECIAYVRVSERLRRSF